MPSLVRRYHNILRISLLRATLRSAALRSRWLHVRGSVNNYDAQIDLSLSNYQTLNVLCLVDSNRLPVKKIDIERLIRSFPVSHDTCSKTLVCNELVANINYPELLAQYTVTTRLLAVSLASPFQSASNNRIGEPLLTGVGRRSPQEVIERNQRALK